MNQWRTVEELFIALSLSLLWGSQLCCVFLTYKELSTLFQLVTEHNKLLMLLACYIRITAVYVILAPPPTTTCQFCVCAAVAAFVFWLQLQLKRAATTIATSNYTSINRIEAVLYQQHSLPYPSLLFLPSIGPLPANSCRCSLAFHSLCYFGVPFASHHIPLVHVPSSNINRKR